MHIEDATHIEANEFVKRYATVWGEDVVDDLFDRGYVPVKLSTGKWAWLLDSVKQPVTVR